MTLSKLNKWVLVSMLLISCYGPKQAEKQVNKAVKKQPKIAADIIRKSFPCTNVDTVVKTETQYDFIEIQCPDTAKVIDHKIDTIIIGNNVVKRIYVPGKNVVVGGKTEIRTVTIKVKDSAEIYLLNEALKNAQLNEQKLQKKISKQLSIIWILILALVISLFFNVLKWTK